MFNINNFITTISGLSQDDLYSLWDQIELAIANCNDDAKRQNLEKKLTLVVDENSNRNKGIHRE